MHVAGSYTSRGHRKMQKISIMNQEDPLRTRPASIPCSFTTTHSPVATSKSSPSYFARSPVGGFRLLSFLFV